MHRVLRLSVAIWAVLGAASLRAQDWKSLESLIKSHDENQRSATIRELTRIGGDRALSLLLVALDDPKPYNRDLASEGIVSIAGAGSIASVLVPGWKALRPLGRRSWADLLSDLRAPFPLDEVLRLLKEEDTRELLLLSLRDVLAAAEKGVEGKAPPGFSRRSWESEKARRLAGREVASQIVPTRWSKSLKAYARDRDRHVRAALVQVVATGPAESRAVHLEWFERERDPGVRCVLLAAWESVDPSRARRLCSAALSASSWRERVQAAEVLGSIGDEASVAALVEALKREAGDSPARGWIAQALESLTGMRFGDKPADWTRWWADHQEDYRLPEKKGRSEARPGARRSTVSYHGVPVASKRVAFVIDNSGSMNEIMGTSSSGEGDARTKKTFALEELAKVVGKLPDDACVNVLLFASEVVAWRKELTPLKGRGRDSLCRWAENIEPRGWTDLLGGILTALEIPDVEEIYVLSDGAPSAGEHVFQYPLRRRIRDRNRLCKVRIHTIALLQKGEDGKQETRIERHRKLLEWIARESGGEAVTVRG